MSGTSPGGIRIVSWKPIHRGSLIGLVTVALNSLQLNDCPVLRSRNGGRWVSLPGKAQLGRDGTVLRNAEGKIQYYATAEWTSREASDRFGHAVIEALLAKYPDALDAEGDDE